MKKVNFGTVGGVRGNREFKGNITVDELKEFLRDHVDHYIYGSTDTASIKFFVENCLGYYVSRDDVNTAMQAIGNMPIPSEEEPSNPRWKVRLYDVYRMEDNDYSRGHMIILDRDGHAVVRI